MYTLLLMRHAESRWNTLKNRATGETERPLFLPSFTDTPLTPYGRLQSVVARRFLRRRYGQIEYAEASDTRRAMESLGLMLPEVLAGSGKACASINPRHQEMMVCQVMDILGSCRNGLMMGYPPEAAAYLKFTFQVYDRFTQALHAQGSACPTPFNFSGNFLVFLHFTKQYPKEFWNILKDPGWHPEPHHGRYWAAAKDGVERLWAEDGSRRTAGSLDALRVSFEDGLDLRVRKDGDGFDVGIERSHIVPTMDRFIRLGGWLEEKLGSRTALVIMHAKRIVGMRIATEFFDTDELGLLEAADLDFPQNASIVEYEIDGTYFWKRVGEPYFLPDGLVYLGDRKVGFRLEPDEVPELCREAGVEPEEIADRLR